MSTPIDIYNGQPGAGNTTLYTCPANTIVEITAVTGVNVNAASKYISLHRVPSGVGVSDANIIVDEKVFTASESKPIWELVGHVLNPGDFLNGIQETADCITLHISGLATPIRPS
jgi:hypothetical protein